MKERTLEGFLEVMEHELAMTEGAIEMMQKVKLDEKEFGTLKRLMEIREKEIQTIKYIKQYRRGLI